MVQCLGFDRRAAPHAQAENLNNTHVSVQREGQHVAGSHTGATAGLPSTVNAHISTGREGASTATRFKEARMPQPFIEPHKGIGAALRPAVGVRRITRHWTRVSGFVCFGCFAAA